MDLLLVTLKFVGNPMIGFGLIAFILFSWGLIRLTLKSLDWAEAAINWAIDRDWAKNLTGRN